MISNSFLDVIFQSEKTTLVPLLQDGSNRQYTRCSFLDKKFVFMILKEPKDLFLLKRYQYDWLVLNHFLREQHIPCPKIEAVFPEEGLLLLEDLGDTDLSLLFEKDHKKWEKAFFESLSFIERFLNFKPSLDSWSSRSFDEEKLYSELCFFYEHFLLEIMNISFSDSEKKMFFFEILDLSKFLSGFSKYFVHRDFHSRNILFFQDSSYVIDFQDARLGHPAYDLVSLCFDSYISLNQDKRIDYLMSFIANGALSFDNRLIIEETWPAVLLQRQLKALGSFGFLTKIRPRNYLIYVPSVLDSMSIEPVLSCEQKWPFLINTILPLCKRHMLENRSKFFDL